MPSKNNNWQALLGKLLVCISVWMIHDDNNQSTTCVAFYFQEANGHEL